MSLFHLTWKSFGLLIALLRNWVWRFALKSIDSEWYFIACQNAPVTVKFCVAPALVQFPVTKFRVFVTGGGCVTQSCMGGEHECTSSDHYGHTVLRRKNPCVSHTSVLQWTCMGEEEQYSLKGVCWAIRTHVLWPSVLLEKLLSNWVWHLSVASWWRKLRSARLCSCPIKNRKLCWERWILSNWLQDYDFCPPFFRVFTASNFETVRFKFHAGELILFQMFFFIAMWIILLQTCYRW